MKFAPELVLPNRVQAVVTKHYGTEQFVTKAIPNRSIRHSPPIYLFSSSEDPVGQQLEGILILIGRSRSAGLSNISHHFYPGGPHEMLNEINSQEVQTNLLLWDIFRAAVVSRSPQLTPAG